MYNIGNRLKQGAAYAAIGAAAGLGTVGLVLGAGRGFDKQLNNPYVTEADKQVHRENAPRQGRILEDMQEGDLEQIQE